MADAGLFPMPATAVVDPAAPVEGAPAAEAVASVPVPEPAADAAVGEPALDVTPPPAEGQEGSDELVAATFGLLRAEPDGSIVIAGSGTPGSEVEVYADDTLLGRTTVESSGDWVLVPEVPVPAGGVEITLAEAGKQGRAAESFVVLIDEDRSTEPLVVASTSGQASEVLQGLESSARMDVATADTASAAPAAQQAAAPVESADAAPAVVEPDAAPAADQPSAQPESQPAPAQPAATDAPAETAPASPAAPARADPAPAEAEPAQVDVAAVPAEAGDAPATSPTAATEPAAAMDTGVTPPTIDAIEVEEGRTFFAGSGPEGATMRLYVDDTYIADAIVEGGRWLVEAGDVLTNPSQRVRVDMLSSGSAEVSARAEVNFVIELPEDGAPTAIATADVPQSPAAEATDEVSEPEEQSAAAPADAPPAPAGSTGTASDPATPAEPVAEAVADAAQPEADVPTLVAISVGDPDAERFAAGKAIIRRGDNLWTIARRVYGEGIRYTTIYEANTGQIRDPDRIYPGQVFDLPSGEN